MEERVPSSRCNHGKTHGDSDHGSHGTDLGPLVLSPATDYERVLVVQIPKDQIYWVPPPENAFIVERHRSPAKKAQQSRLCSCFSWCSCISMCIVVSFFMAIFLVVITILPYTIGLVFLPRVPVFHIKHFSAKSVSHVSNQQANARLQYEITLMDENPNPLAGISYEEDGQASLSCKAREIAAGKYPPLNQVGKETSSVKLILEGLAVKQPEDIQKSMTNTKSKIQVSFSLEMDVPAKMRIGMLKSGLFKFTVSCNFVVDTLEKNQAIRVLSQKCNTKRKSL